MVKKKRKKRIKYKQRTSITLTKKLINIISQMKKDGINVNMSELCERYLVSHLINKYFAYFEDYEKK